jgi:steroid 5-alpha reductase family enzyme
MAWENMKEIKKTSAEQSLGIYELKQHFNYFFNSVFWFIRSKEAG